MNRQNLLFEIEKFILKLKKDYQDNIISKDKCELMYNELFSLVKNIETTDFLLLATKFDTIKTVYIIMK